MFLAICVPAAIVLAYETPVFVSGHNRGYDIRAFSQRLGARAEPGADILTFRYQSLALQFYADRPVRRVQGVGEVMTAVAGGRPLYVVAEDRAWPELADASGRIWTVVDRAQMDGRALSVRTPEPRP
jgi:hypothetical protein